MSTLVDFRHRAGEALLGRDLRAELATDARRRALHVCAVHGTWGVALGFELGPGERPGEIRVGPGFGYDRRGRAIVSPAARPVRLSADQQATDLVVSGARGVRFGWREPGRACDDELVLASGRATLAGKALELDQSSRVCCRARRFRIESGIAEVTLERQIWIPTAGAAFARDPSYFATLETETRLAATLEIADESSTWFRLVLRAPEAQWNGVAGMDVPARVHWSGVERLPACAVGALDEEEEE